MEFNFDTITPEKLRWQKTRAEGLDIDYVHLLPQALATKLMTSLEDVDYNTGDLARVRVYGKWHPIPRQQAAFGNADLTYKFSGNSIPAKPWRPDLFAVRDLLFRITGYSFNFVLVNRYRNGADYIGEHRDNEKQLDPDKPIASLSLGQARDFILRHADARKSGAAKRNIPKVKVVLEHGSLLMMNSPTNEYWYHSLPPRKNCSGGRINLTFRQFTLESA